MRNRRNSAIFVILQSHAIGNRGMQLPILYYGNPILRKKTSPVLEITDEIRAFIHDLEETMLAHNGIGIAAPQVGKSVAIFLTSFPLEDDQGHFRHAPTRIFINPKLSNPSTETWLHEEGCLSIPKYYGEVERPVKITVTAQDIDGKEFTEQFEGWPARVCMHENDHLNGVLFPDRMSPKKRQEIEPILRQIKKHYNP